MISEQIFKFTAWSIRKIGLGTLISLLLLLLVLCSIAYGLKEIAYIREEMSLILIAAIGVLTGWILARSSLRGRYAGVIVTLVGVVLVVIHTAQMSSKVIASLKELLWLALQTLKWHPGFPLPDAGLLQLLLIDISRITASLIERLGGWLWALITGSPQFDTSAASLIWGALVWAISVWAGWAVRRRGEPFFAVLPGIALLAFGMAFSRINLWYMLPVLGGALFLFAWVSFNQKKGYWDHSSIDYAEDIYVDTIVWSGAVVLFVVTISASLSYVSPQKILNYLSSIGQPSSEEITELGESLGLQQNPDDPLEQGVGIPPGELPREHLIGSGSELDQQVVMIIETDRATLFPTETPGSAPDPSYYWRSLNYDIYTGKGWATSATYDIDYPPDTTLPQALGPTYQPLEQTVGFFAEIGNRVHVAGELISIDQDHLVTRRVALPDIEEPQPADMFSATLENVNRYQAKSLVNIAGKDQLNAAGTAYPPWISERYLQLPDDLPPRVIDLAEELTAAAETPYEKAQALENYLRQIPYTLDVPRTPEDRDVVDFFIFDLRKGYCDYYASSMAVLGRAVGLPTRLVIGYATGIYDDSQDRFIITAKNAHSWVEVYFPGIGWVEFEPTGGLPAILHPDSIPIDELIETIPVIPPKPNPWRAILPWLVRIAVGIIVLFLVFFLWRISDTWRLRRMTADTASATLYRRLFRQGQRLEIAQQPSSTPHEYTASLNAHIGSLVSPDRWQPDWQGQIHAAQDESQTVVNLYTRTIYSSQVPDREDVHQAILAWNRLRRRLWLVRVLSRWQNPEE